MAERKEKGDERRRKKSAANKNAAATAKATVEKDSGYATGYETDGGQSVTSGKRRPKLRKKQKPVPGSTGGDAGYETDDGYTSASAKPKSKSSRFFRLGNKSKTNVDGDDASGPTAEPMPPPPPPVPVFRLPIAERFATTLGNLNAGATVDPPLGPAVLPPAATSPTSSPPTSASTSIPTPKDLEGPFPDPLDATAASKANPATWVDRIGLHFSTDSSNSTSASDNPTSATSIFSKVGSPASSPTSSPPLSKIPLISMPLTRPPSPPSQQQPIPKDSPSKAGTRRVPDPLSLSPYPLNGSNPSPITPPDSSSFVVLTPVDPAAPPPSENVSTAPAPSRTLGRFFTTRSKSPSRPTPTLVIPSSNYIVPSPVTQSPQQLEPPQNTYSYYELPPPSPPPTMPLPKPPMPTYTEPESDTEYRAVSPQQRFLNLRPNQSSNSRPVSPMGTPRRGKESPFPARPVLPASNRDITSPSTRIGAGLEARLKVDRYRALYTLPVPDGYQPGSRSVSPDVQAYYANPNPRALAGSPAPNARAQYGGNSGSNSPPRPAKANRYGVRFRESTAVGIDVEEPSDNEDWGYGYEDEDDTEMRGVIDRFDGSTQPGSGGRSQTEPALGRTRSFEALKNRYADSSNAGMLAGRPRRQSPPQPQPRAQAAYTYTRPSYSEEGEESESHYEDDQRPTLYSQNAGSSVSVASRNSIMDQTKSEAARERFVRRIEAMFDEKGMEKLPSREIPPVPKLPKGIVAGPTPYGRRNGWI